MRCTAPLASTWKTASSNLGGPNWPADYPAAFLPVTGTVTLDGKPLDHVQVNYIPLREGGVMATGETDQTGRYHLSYNDKPGTPPGEYRVIMSYRTDPKGVPITRAMNSTLLMPRELTQAEERLPRRYVTRDSQLFARVTEGENVIDFKLQGPLEPLVPKPVE